MTRNHARAVAFLDKSRRLLRWSRATLDQMYDHGRAGMVDDFERSFFSQLALIAAAHDGLSSAARLANMPDWEQRIAQLRRTDPVLKYLWKARDADIHDAIVKWEAGLRVVELTVVDAVKTNRIGRQFYAVKDEAEEIFRVFMYVFEVYSKDELVAAFNRRALPNPTRLSDAGLEFNYAIDSISLKAFQCRVRGRFELIEAPTHHMGREHGVGAHEASLTAINFYDERLRDLSALILPKEGPGP